MNAIISLCHFCELHGPKVLFCTQPLHLEEKNAECESDTTGEGIIQTRRVVTPSVSAEPQTPQTPTHNSLPNYKNDLCEVRLINKLVYYAVIHFKDFKVLYLYRVFFRVFFSMVVHVYKK